MRVSDYIAQFFEEHNIKKVFGIVGAGNAQIFDSISQLNYTEIIYVHHEQAAVMAAGAFYRASGKISAALLTTGGGSTNGITGVVSAWMDSIPLIVISGNENSKFTKNSNPLRIWGVQGYDSTKMVSDVTKWTYRVDDSLKIKSALQYGMHQALHGRKGPVWIDVPMNIQSSMFSDNDKKINKCFLNKNNIFKNKHSNLNSGVKKSLSLIQKSRRPLLLLGAGLRNFQKQNKLISLLDKINIPFVLSWQASDLIKTDHSLNFGRPGVYGQRYSNFIIQNTDCLICVGTRLAIPQIGYDINEFAREASIVQVDIDPNELDKYFNNIDVTVLSDANDFLNKLSASIKVNNFSTWKNFCNKMKNKYPILGKEHRDPVGKDGKKYINSYRFMVHLENFFANDQIIVTDMGTALLSGHQIIKLKSRQRMFTSTGLGEMGYGLPAAIGAALANKNKDILCLNCDGGMMLNLQELQTIKHYNLSIKIIIFNNDGYLMIKHTQNNLFNGRYVGVNKKTGVSCPDFGKLAKAFGFPAFKINKVSEIDRKLTKVFQTSGPVICEIMMHPEQMFYPKLSVAKDEKGILVSPPLEDLSPLVEKDDLEDSMLIPIHAKSSKIRNS
ncbi:acetolactate synthase [beta proteobacterium KB13]|uniref:Acetolactate synthase n=1 Tax=beta proteobacterium KB13 TaxID=314607 RepID=B6BTI0_9PROT|nr:acetolactate synthase [beta proteobacterium KB13]